MATESGLSRRFLKYGSFIYPLLIRNSPNAKKHTLASPRRFRVCLTTGIIERYCHYCGWQTVLSIPFHSGNSTDTSRRCSAERSTPSMTAC